VGRRHPGCMDACRYLVSQGHEVALLCEGVENKPECERVDDVLILRYRVSKYDFNFLNRHQIAGYKVLKGSCQIGPRLALGHMPLQTVAMMKAFPGVKLSYTVCSPVALEILQSKAEVSTLLRIKSLLGSRIEQKCLSWASVICAHRNTRSRS